MSRHRIVPILALTLAPALATAQPAAGLWRFAHPNAKVVVSFDWQRIKQSQSGAMMRDQLRKSPAASAIPGMEFLDDVDRVLISSPGEKTSDTAQAEPDAAQAVRAGLTVEAPVLIAVHGHFDLTKLRQALVKAGTKPQMFNSIQVYRPQTSGSREMAIVPLDATTVLLGDAPSVFASLERNKFAPPAPEAGSLLARAAEMDANYEIWMLITDPKALGGDKLTQMLTGGDPSEEAKGVEAGLALDNGLAADITLRFTSDGAATKLVAQMSGLMKLAAMQQGSDPVIEEVSRKVKFSADGPVARISLHLTQQELQKDMQMVAAAQLRRAAAAAATRSAVQPSIRPVVTAPSAPPKPAVIRIEGLDEGTRVVPYHEP